MVLYARISDATQDVLDKLSVENAPVVAKQGEWIAVSSPGAANNRTIAVTRGPYTLCEVGVYTPEDWAKLYDATSVPSSPIRGSRAPATPQWQASEAHGNFNHMRLVAGR